MVAESLVTTDLPLPLAVDPDLVLGIGREIAISCPYTHLGHPISVGLHDRETGRGFMRLTIEADVYDHRYEPEMQTIFCGAPTAV